MIKVLIADDHSIVRDALRLLCEGIDGLMVADEAGCGDEVMAALGRERFGLVLLDLSMPGASGSSLVEHIRIRHADTRILVFSMNNEPQVIKRVLREGAAGYVSKGSRQSVLKAAIQKVLAGERFVDPLLAEQMMWEQPSRTATRDVPLSARELQIMKLMAQGMSGKEIAGLLFISDKTVSAYKTSLMRKMNFRNNAELVLYVAQHGLSDTDASDSSE
jgi:DNA-binding NarL/FixJ family response regulator